MNRPAWFKQVKLLLVIILTVPFVTGCWDRIEIERRAILLGIGIDEAPASAGNTETNATYLKDPPIKPTPLLMVTAQIAIPGRIPLGHGQGSGAKPGPEQPVWVVSSTGVTIDDAIMNLQQKVAYRLFFGHLRAIVVSEAIAKKGVHDISDFLRRNSEVRRTGWMMVASDKASKVMNSAPPLERVPTLYLTGMLDEAVRLGKLPNMILGRVWAAASSKGEEPILPYIRATKDNVLIDGVAYFRGDKMVGKTNPIEIGIVMELRKVKHGGYSMLTTIPGTSGAAVMIEVSYRKSRIDVDMRNGQPHVTAKVHLEGNIVEKISEKIKIDNQQILKTIEKTFAQKVSKGQDDLIKRTQQAGSDIFGFGERIRGKFPGYWNQQVKNKQKWEEVYKNITVENHVTASIRRQGMKAQ